SLLLTGASTLAANALSATAGTNTVSYASDTQGTLTAPVHWTFNVVNQAPGTPAYNPNWYAAGNIYLDPVSGNDSNDGLSSGTAIKTAAEMIRRFGSTSPYLNASLTINQLSTQTS